MQWLIDVITLRFFITPYLILLIYWFGAFVTPLFVWLASVWLLNKAKENEAVSAGLGGLGSFFEEMVNSRHVKKYFWLMFGLVFFFLELIWRLIFEFLIAYFHIHDALIQLTSH